MNSLVRLPSCFVTILSLNFISISNSDLQFHIRFISSSSNLLLQDIVKLIIQRYTREAGIRNLERNLAALARAAAVKFTEQQHTVQHNKPVTASLLDTRLVDDAEVEMEEIPVNSYSSEISKALQSASTLQVDEDMLVKVLGVIRLFLNLHHYVVSCHLTLPLVNFLQSIISYFNIVTWNPAP